MWRGNVVCVLSLNLSKLQRLVVFYRSWLNWICSARLFKSFSPTNQLSVYIPTFLIRIQKITARLSLFSECIFVRWLFNIQLNCQSSKKISYIFQWNGRNVHTTNIRTWVNSYIIDLNNIKSRAREFFIFLFLSHFDILSNQLRCIQDLMSKCENWWMK